MRVFLSAILLSIVLADDKSFCEKKCAEKYAEGANRDACSVGCEGRASFSSGPFAFVDCHRSCDSKFVQNNGTSDVSEAHSACSYACSLPMSRSILMSVDYSNGGKPVVKIIRKEGDEVPAVMDRAPLTGDIDVDRFVANILGDVNRHLLAFRNPFNPAKSASEQQDVNTSPEDFGMMGLANHHMMAMHNRMNEMLAAFSRQFFDGIRRQMHNHHFAMHRPRGHDDIAHMGPEIGNMMSNGEPIIITHPLSAAEEDEMKGRPIKVVRYHMSSNHPPSIFYWVMIVFGIGALLLTLYASVIFFRVMRSAAYRRISAEAPGRRPAAPPAPGVLPVKKVPIDGWVESSEPAGVPPPAYDQVSIHSVQKQKSPDPAEQPLSGAETDTPSPIMDQK